MSLTAADKKEHLLGLSIVVAILLPHTSIVMYMINPLLCLLLAFVCKAPKVSRIQYAVIISISISILIAIATNYVESKSFVRAVSILIYLTLFPFVSDIRVRNEYLYFCFATIVVSQLATMFYIPFLSNFFDTLYPISEDDTNGIEYGRENITMNTINNFRLGGLFHNSNHCSKYTTFLLAFFLANNQKKTIKENLPIIIIIAISVLMTGSRTGFVTLLGILFVYIFNRNDVSNAVKSVFVIASLVFGIITFNNGSDNYRALNVSEGLDSSINAKLEALIYHLKTEDSPLRLFFGYLDTGYFNPPTTIMGSFDGEFGDLIYSYGFVGFISIIIFYISCFRLVNKQYRLFFVVMLWMISSTIICSYRCCFVFFLMLSSLVSKNIGKTPATFNNNRFQNLHIKND